MSHSNALQTIAGTINTSRLVSEQVQAVEHLLKLYKLPSLQMILRLSNTAYEGAANCAEIAFFRSSLFFQEQAKEILTVEFIHPTFLSDEVIEYDEAAGETRTMDNRDCIRILRKYCQMVGNGYQLLATPCIDGLNHAYYICGIGKAARQDDVFATLRFMGHMKWELEIEATVIRFDGVFSIPREKNDEVLKKAIQEEFPDYEPIAKLVQAASQQKHGTLLVFLSDEHAASETQRLCSKSIQRGIAIETKPMNLCTLSEDQSRKMEALLLSMSAIDGAILLDEHANCHAVGVILDGAASVEANLGRGARYNSAKTYVYAQKAQQQKCLCAIISEDGMVNVFGTHSSIQEPAIDAANIMDHNFRDYTLPQLYFDHAFPPDVWLDENADYR